MNIKEKLRFEIMYYIQMWEYAERDSMPLNAAIYRSNLEECQYLLNWLEEYENDN